MTKSRRIESACLRKHIVYATMRVQFGEAQKKFLRQLKTADCNKLNFTGHWLTKLTSDARNEGQNKTNFSYKS